MDCGTPAQIRLDFTSKASCSLSHSFFLHGAPLMGPFGDAEHVF